MVSTTTIDSSTSTLLKWYFPSTAALKTAYPVGWNGWIAFVGPDQYWWDSTLKRWTSGTVTGMSVSDMYTFTSTSVSWPINVNYSVTKVDATAGTITISLPTAVGFVWMLNILKIDSSLNTVIVDPIWAETISWETSQTIYGQYDNMTIVSDNSNWLIV